MTVKEINSNRLSLEELKNIPFKDLYGYRDMFWEASDEGDTVNTKQASAYKEFVKAKDLIKWVEKTYTPEEEMEITEKFGEPTWNDFNKKFNI